MLTNFVLKLLDLKAENIIHTVLYHMYCLICKFHAGGGFTTSGRRGGSQQALPIARNAPLLHKHYLTFWFASATVLSQRMTQSNWNSARARHKNTACLYERLSGFLFLLEMSNTPLSSNFNFGLFTCTRTCASCFEIYTMYTSTLANSGLTKQMVFTRSRKYCWKSITCVH